MKDLIQQIDGWEDLTAEQLHEKLVTADPQRIPEERATWRTNKLLDRLDVNVAEALVAALRSVGLNASADALTATGLDFGNPKMQRMLDKLGNDLPDVFTEPIVDDLKSLGVDSRSPWQRANGDDPEPTVEDVQAALDAIANEQEGLRAQQRGRNATNAAVAAAESGGDETAQRNALIASWDGSA